MLPLLQSRRSQLNQLLLRSKKLDQSMLCLQYLPSQNPLVSESICSKLLDFDSPVPGELAYAKLSKIQLAEFQLSLSRPI